MPERTPEIATENSPRAGQTLKGERGRDGAGTGAGGGAGGAPGCSLSKAVLTVVAVVAGGTLSLRESCLGGLASPGLCKGTQSADSEPGFWEPWTPGCLPGLGLEHT